MNNLIPKITLIKCLVLMLMIALSFNTAALSKREARKEFRNQGKAFYNSAISDLKNREKIPNLCRFGLDFKSNSVILSELWPLALDGGLRHGDVLKKVGNITFKSPITTGISAIEQLKNVPASKGDVVNWVIDRDGQTLKIPVECPNSKIEYWTYMKEIGYLMMKGKTLECLDAVNRNKAIMRRQWDYYWLRAKCAGRAYNDSDISLTSYSNIFYDDHIAQIDLLFYRIQHIESDSLIRKFISKRESIIDSGADWFSRNKKASLGRNLQSHWDSEKQNFLNRCYQSNHKDCDFLVEIVSGPTESKACTEAKRSLQEWQKFMKDDAASRKLGSRQAYFAAGGRAGATLKYDAISQQRAGENLIQKQQLRSRLIDLEC